MWKAIGSAIVLSSFGVAAHAQAPVQTPYGPDNGFFRPAPDASLTAPRTPQTGAPAQPFLTPYVTLQQPTSQPMQQPMPQASTLPTQAVPQPSTAATVAVVPVPVNTPAPQASSPAATANAPSAAVERQMDRSVEEADRERARVQSTPPGVGAAFDGTTSAENR